MASVELAQVAAGWAEGAAADLQGLLGCEVTLGPAAVKQGPRDALIGGIATAGGDPLHAVLRTRDDARQPVHLLAAASTAHGLAAARLGEPAPDSAAPPPLAGDAYDAFVESVELCAGILGRVLSELGELPGLEYEACAALSTPLADDAALAGGRYRRLSFALGLAGSDVGSLLLLFPAELAEAWFGPAEDADDDGLPLAVIDPDPEARSHAETLAEELGRAVWTLDPAELGPHSFEELSETGAVVVAWDLGGVPGLDLLDDLRGDPRTAGIPVALATPVPTRDRVLMALRWGAATVLHQPLDAGEVTRRLTSRGGA